MTGRPPVERERKRRSPLARRIELSQSIGSSATLTRAAPRPSGQEVRLTKAQRGALASERRRTRLNARQILCMCDCLPDGLTARVVNGWLAGHRMTANPDQFEFVIALYRAQPDFAATADGEGRYAMPGSCRARRADSIPLTPEMQIELRKEVRRLGSSPAKISRRLKEAEFAFEAQRLQAWAAGRPKTVERAKWRGLMQTLRAMAPVAPPEIKAHPLDAARPPGVAGREDYRPVTLEERRRIQEERDRTGVTPRALLAEASDRPLNISAEMIDAWQRGATRNASERSLRWVLNAYARLPDRPLHTKP